ncbi:aspartate/glutamate racemase family protein [Candidatus Saccharibacteria bacterium]|nr:aspartate/glutamate racemase family protein [Candidatus Saccharibacteria bacterium]
MRPIIGILGGMGPRATVQFEQLLLDRFPGSDQSIPTIVSINDGAIPDRSAFLLGRGSDPVPRMQRNLAMLEQAGADIVCLPCNTASVPTIANRLQTFSSHFISLPAEVEKVVLAGQPRRVCVLATRGTIQSKMYQQICQQLGIDVVVPDRVMQQLVTRCINLVKAGDVVAARNYARQIAMYVQSQSCDAAILGCTELPLIAETIVPQGCQAFDTLAILADACAELVAEGVNHETRSIHA